MHCNELKNILELLREQRYLLMNVDAAQTPKEMIAAYAAFSQHLAKVDELMNRIPFDELQETEREQLLEGIGNLRLDTIHV